MNLNIENWKEFKLTDLFNIYQSKGDNQADSLDNGSIPLVSAGSTDNGIVKFVDSGDGISEIIKGNCITADMFGKCWYQLNDFYCVSHGRVNILEPKYKDFNSNIGLFICTILELEFKLKNSYGRMLTLDKLEQTVIKLPTKGDLPDYVFMDSYISEKKSKKITTKNNKNIFDYKQKKWKNFKISDLFNVDTGGDIFPNEEETGDIPVICLGWENNGVCMKIKKNEKHPLYPACTMTVAGWAGGLKAFYQPDPYYVKGRIKICYPKFDMNEYSCLFICTIINYNSYLFSYGRKASGEKFLNINISLPIKDDGTPDFKYMEDTIKNLPFGDRIKH